MHEFDWALEVCRNATRGLRPPLTRQEVVLSSSQSFRADEAERGRWINAWNQHSTQIMERLHERPTLKLRK